MEARVHPQDEYGRPGWITTDDFGLGMITNWSAQVILDDRYSNGVRFGGSDGCVFCARGAAQVTGSDPTVQRVGVAGASGLP